MKKTPLAIAMALVVASLTGCSVQNINRTEAQNKSKMVSSTETLDTIIPQNVEWTPNVWVNPHPIQVKKTVKIPYCNITLIVPRSTTLHSIAGQISQSCGYPVWIADEQLSQSKQPQQAAYAPINNQANTDKNVIHHLAWQGSLTGLLNKLASETGMVWKFDGHTIQFLSQDTRTYQLAVLNSKIGTKSEVNSGSTSTAGTSGGDTQSSVSGSNSTTQTASVESSSNLYDDIQKSIQTLLSPTGKFFLSTSTGTLTVKDNEQVLDEIGHYVDQENKKLNRQVILKIQVVSVSTSHADGLGLDWSLVYKSLHIGGGLSGGGSLTGGDNAISGNINILDGNFAGSNLMLNALAQQGTVKVLTTQYSTTTNLVPVNIQTADQTNYIASNQTTSTAQVGTQTSITQGSVTTGFNMTVMPYIMDDEQHLQLQVALNMSDPPVIRSVKSKDGTTQIEMPSVKSKTLTQKVDLRSGQTLIMSGTNQENAKTNKNGAFSPDNILLGGTLNGQTDNNVLIVLVSPTVL